MKTYAFGDILKKIKKDGWVEVRCKGDHHQFQHPFKKGTYTLSGTRSSSKVSMNVVKEWEKATGLLLR